MARTRPCGAEVRRGRLRKAGRFLDVADSVRDLADQDDDLADAYVTLCVHAGIAASDAICCARLGEHARGENHQEAVKPLGRADEDAAKHLTVLLGMKTRTAYSHTPATSDDCKRAGRAAEALLKTARMVAAR